MNFLSCVTEEVDGRRDERKYARHEQVVGLSRSISSDGIFIECGRKSQQKLITIEHCASFASLLEAGKNIASFVFVSTLNTS